MDIGINVSRLSGQRLGVGRYLEYMLKYWSGMLLPNERVHAYLRDPVAPESIAHLGLSPSIRLECVSPRLPSMIWENVVMANRARPLDVLFGPSYSLPLLFPSTRRRVVATHSVNQAQTDVKARYRDQLYEKRDQYSARSADAVIVPCDSTADLVTSIYGVDATKIAVIPQGADVTFRPLNDPEQTRKTRIRFLGDDVPYVLFVGKLSARRNIPMLIEAFARVRKALKLPHKLLLVGPNHVNLPLAQVCEQHGVSDVVVQTDGTFTNHEELIFIYNAADVFVHPSGFEGWSMTTIEALACGTATIATNRGGLGDVARGHAYMLDDPTVDALSHALQDVLGDDALRRELQTLARRRGSSITWEYTTQETLDVVRRVANS